MFHVNLPGCITCFAKFVHLKPDQEAASWPVSKPVIGSSNRGYLDGWTEATKVLQSEASTDLIRDSRCLMWVFPKIVGFPSKIIYFNRVFHYFHHPFWGFPPIFGNIHVGETMICTKNTLIHIINPYVGGIESSKTDFQRFFHVCHVLGR